MGTSTRDNVRTFVYENQSSTSSSAFEDVLNDIKPEDLQAFSSFTDNFFDWIKKDGGRASASPRDPKIRAELDVVSHALHVNDNSQATPKDYLSHLSKLVFFFFIFLFMQVFAFMFMYDEEEDIPLFEFSSSSILFSMTSILMES